MIRIKEINSETLIGSGILLILVLASVIILVKQSYFDLSEYGLNVKTEALGNAAVKSTGIAGGSFVPSGFSPFMKPEKYDSGTLYEKIDGKAPLYLSSGFRELVTWRYAGNSDKRVWIEVFRYDMGSFDNAFAVYSQQKRADGKGRPGIQNCYTTDNSEVFVHNSFYVEVIGSVPGAVITDAAAEISREMRAGKESRKITNALSYIQGPEFVPGSEIYYLKDAFGMEGFSNVYSAQYRVKGATVTVYVSGPYDAEKEGRVINTYRNFLLREGGSVEKAGSSVSGLAMVNFMGYYETIFSVGNLIAGVHEAEDKDTAIKVSEILSRTIKKTMEGE